MTRKRMRLLGVNQPARLARLRFAVREACGRQSQSEPRLRSVRAINFLQRWRGEERPTCADEAEDRRKDGLSLVAGADDGLRRAVHYRMGKLPRGLAGPLCLIAAARLLLAFAIAENNIG